MFWLHSEVVFSSDSFVSCKLWHGKLGNQVTSHKTNQAAYPSPCAEAKPHYIAPIRPIYPPDLAWPLVAQGPPFRPGSP